MLFSKCLWWCPLEYFSIFCSCLLHNSVTFVVLSLTIHSGWSKTVLQDMRWGCHDPLCPRSWLFPCDRSWLLMARAGGCPLLATNLRLWLWFDFAGAGLWSLVTAGQLQHCSKQPIMQQVRLRLCSRWDFCSIVLYLPFVKNNEAWSMHDIWVSYNIAIACLDKRVTEAGHV